MSADVPEEWADFIEDQVPSILRLVADTWGTLNPPAASNEREDDISNRLCLALQKNRDVRQMMFYVLPQVVLLEPSAGAELGRLDITFLPSGHDRVPSENIYFCLECKRLNVRDGKRSRSYASEYVAFGMIRFVSGQYSKSVRHGGMIGYVLDGRVPQAMNQVEANVRAKSAALGMAAPGAFQASVILAGYPYARETHHRRGHDAEVFRIHHMFFAGDPGRVLVVKVNPSKGKVGKSRK